MNMKKPFTLLAALIFAAIALIHLLRLIFGWVVTVVGADVPMWGSGVALVVSGILAAGLWWESRK
jgi:hypothetical protein